MAEEFTRESCKQSLIYIGSFLDKFRKEASMNILNFITYPELANLYFSQQRLNAYFNFNDKNVSLELAKTSVKYIIHFFEKLRHQTNFNMLSLFNYVEITNLYMATVRLQTYTDNQMNVTDDVVLISTENTLESQDIQMHTI